MCDKILDLYQVEEHKDGTVSICGLWFDGRSLSELSTEEASLNASVALVLIATVVQHVSSKVLLGDVFKLRRVPWSLEQIQVGLQGWGMAA
jgi:hypothetical protein